MADRKCQVTFTIPVTLTGGSTDAAREALIQMARDYLSCDEDMDRTISTYGWEVEVRAAGGVVTPKYQQEALWGDPVPYVSPPPESLILQQYSTALNTAVSRSLAESMRDYIDKNYPPTTAEGAAP
jgi:hypothetical protein